MFFRTIEIVPLILFASVTSAVSAVDYSKATWEELLDFNNVTVSRWQYPDIGIYASRAVGAVYGDVAAVASIILDVERRHELFPELLDNFVIENVSLLERIEYMSIQMPGPLKNRDFVYRSLVESDREGKWLTIQFRSIDDRDRSSAEFIRGQILDISFVLRQREPGITDIDMTAAIDPRGEVPLGLAEMVQRNVPMNAILAIRHALVERATSLH